MTAGRDIALGVVGAVVADQPRKEPDAVCAVVFDVDTVCGELAATVTVVLYGGVTTDFAVARAVQGQGNRPGEVAAAGGGRDRTNRSATTSMRSSGTRARSSR